ncbi:hypothetical protein [uncultured Faecalibaculum sp.]|uniref:hypothetical protein n=1 Tax=uncultured Faecalibaculum sp. TaxID=1729681 RepID=UPI0025DC95D5|nr:hypothetical protein [uncultured Faecalibaculum sp.]
MKNSILMALALLPVLFLTGCTAAPDPTGMYPLDEFNEVFSGNDHPVETAADMYPLDEFNDHFSS